MDPELIAYLDRRFDEVDRRFDEVNRRFDATDNRLDGLEGRFDGLEGRFDGLEGRFDGLEGRFDGLEGRFDGLEGRFERLEDTVHLMGVRIENIESKVELLAEGQGGLREIMARDKAELNQKIEDLRRDLNLFARHVNERFDGVDDRLEKLEALEGRVTLLEKRLAS